MDTIELPPIHTCPNCGSDKVTEAVRTYPVQYRHKGTRGAYMVTAPVMKCGIYGGQWTDWRAEELSDATFKAQIAEIESRKARGDLPRE